MKYSEIPGLSNLEDEFIELTKKYAVNKHKLVTKHVNKEAKFKRGDFIYCVLGVIQVEKISWMKMFDDVTITYEGPKYRRSKGELIRTKSTPRDVFNDNGNLIKLNIKEWKIIKS